MENWENTPDLRGGEMGGNGENRKKLGNKENENPGYANAGA